MKARYWYVVAICFSTAVTLLTGLAETNLLAKLVVYVSGIFSILVTLAIFVVCGRHEKTDKQDIVMSDSEVMKTVRLLRHKGCSDYAIALSLRMDIDVVKAIP